MLFRSRKILKDRQLTIIGLLTLIHSKHPDCGLRFPLGYGSQRPYSATWTVTGAGAFLLNEDKGDVQIRGITTGKIKDYGVQDPFNMGACMAPAAADTIYQSLVDFEREPKDFDRIITGDLGAVGQKLLFELLDENHKDIKKNHMDCGMQIFDEESQDTHAGGSGCACSALMLSAVILPKLASGEWTTGYQSLC